MRRHSPAPCSPDGPVSRRSHTLSRVATFVLAILAAASFSPRGFAQSDSFAGATTISGFPATVSGNNSTASAQAGEPRHSYDPFYSAIASLWWRWTAQSTQLVEINTFGSEFNTQLSVYTGNSLGGLETVAKNEASPGGEDFDYGGRGTVPLSRIRFQAQAGVTYRIAVDSPSSLGPGEPFGGPITLNITNFTPAPNDTFADAAEIHALPFSVDPDIQGATHEPLEPQHAGDSGYGSLWWKWTAPTGGRFSVNTGDGFQFEYPDTLLAVYTGASIDALTLVASNDDFGGDPLSRLNFTAEPGVTYYIAVDVRPESEGLLHLDFESVGNDDFAGRTPISGEVLSLSAATELAGAEIGEPDHAGVPAERTRWWEWMAPATARFEFNTLESGFADDTRIAIYTGDSLETLSEVSSNDDADDHTSLSRTTIEAVAGTTYLVAVDAGGGGTRVSLNIFPSSRRPPGDDFEYRNFLTGGSVDVSSTLSLGTVEPGEPVHGNAAGRRSEWWEWVAPAAGLYSVDTAGSAEIMTLALYQGGSLDSLVAVASDDGRSRAEQAQLVINAQAGERFLVALDTLDGFTFFEPEVRLRITALAPPTNDDFADRIALGMHPVQTGGSNAEATEEVGEPSHHDFRPPGPSVWWSFESPTGGQFEVTTFGSDFNTVLAVYEGSSLAGLTKIASNDNSGGSRIDSTVFFEAEAGVDYSIAVTGVSGSTGRIQLSVVRAGGSEVTTPVAALPDVDLAKGGTVNVIRRLPDGALLLGGSFSRVNGLLRNNLAKVAADGTVDPLWNPDIDGEVQTLLVDGDWLYVGGEFEGAGAAPVANLARVSLTGAGDADPAWTPAPDGMVYALARSGSHLVIGGGFQLVRGLEQAFLARVDPHGGGEVDETWRPAVEPNSDADFFGDVIFDIESDSSHVYVSGNFAQIDGTSVPACVRFTNATGAVDVGWVHGYEESGLDGNGMLLEAGAVYVHMRSNFTNAPGVVKLRKSDAGTVWENTELGGNDFALFSNHLYVAGFNSVGGLPIDPDSFQVGLARFDPATGEPDVTWVPDVPPFTFARTLAVGPEGVVVGGRYSEDGVSPFIGTRRLSVGSASTDLGFTANCYSPGEARAISRQPDGRIIVGGDFLLANGQRRRNLLRLNADGTIDQSWRPETDGAVNFCELSEGNVFVVGEFGVVNGTARGGFAKIRIGSSDALDTLWDPASAEESFAGRIDALVLHDDHLYVSGFSFSRGLLRLPLDGTGAPDPNWPVDQPGRSKDLLVDGGFLYVANDSVARLDLASGTVDASWSPDASSVFSDFSSLAISGSHLYVGGEILGAGADDDIFHLLRFSLAGGVLDTTWKPNPGGPISSLAQNGSYLYAAGEFRIVAGAPRRRLARFSFPEATLDLGWNPGADRAASTLAIDGDNLYLGGAFTEVASERRGGVAMIPQVGAPVIAQDPASLRIQISRNENDGEEVTHFQISSVVGGTLFLPDGVRALRSGDFVGVAAGLEGLVFQPDGSGLPPSVSATSALGDLPRSAAGTPSSLPVNTDLPSATVKFEFGDVEFEEPSTPGSFFPLSLRVLKSGAATDVTLAVDGITATEGFSDDYFVPGGTTLSFSEGDAALDLNILVRGDGETEGDEELVARIVSATNGAVIVGPSATTVTLVDADATGPRTSLTEIVDSDTLPTHSGSLSIDITPPESEWRIRGGLVWNGTEATVSGLTAGQYDIEFRLPGGFLRNSIFTVTSDGTSHLSESYTPISDVRHGSGDLSVVIEPSVVANNGNLAARGQWRFEGESDSDWRDTGAIENVAAGVYYVEFKEVSGRAKLQARRVVVGASQTNLVTAVYQPENSSAAPVPSVVTLSTLANSRPYMFNGQVSTSRGVGSGFVVRSRTVLSAAHVLFGDDSLAWSQNVRWHLQRHRNEHEPPPQLARGFYSLRGYSDQRERDLSSGGSSGISTAASQRLDAAAIFFSAPAGRGGFGGYLLTDDDNDWLADVSTMKFIAGYPVNSIPEASIGKLHATSPATLSFVQIDSGVYDTSDVRTFAGNSGGPVYVRSGGQYYPAGIYLGGTGTTRVRAIDLDVLSVVHSAETSAQGDGNGTGGLGNIVAGLTADRFEVGTLLVDTNLPRGRWRVQDRGEIPPLSGGVTYVIPRGEYLIAFEPVAGFATPPPHPVDVVAGQTTRISTNYTVTLESWASQYGLGGVSALSDDDQDGIPLLLEFGFNTDPSRPETETSAGSGDSGLPSVYLTGEPGSRRLAITFVRRVASTTPGLTYVVEFGSDLGDWTPADLATQTTSVVPIDGSWERVVVEDTVLTQIGERRYGRVRIRLAK